MAWVLEKCDSYEGEKTGRESIIGFRGSRYSVKYNGSFGISDYNGEFTEHNDSVRYVKQLRNGLKHLTENWSGRLRIRGNGDTYCKFDGKSYYVGRTIFDEKEYFPGYVLNLYSLDTNSTISQKNKFLFSGCHNSGQIGERWTIPAKSFAARNNKIGNVGIKIRKGEWAWSRHTHSDFIAKMRKKFHLENFIRFYITSNGFLVRPIDGKFWSSYDIDIIKQMKKLSSTAIKSEISANIRLKKSKSSEHSPTLYFCFGHINDMLEGKIPSASNDSDGRAEDIDQDAMRWG